MGWFRNWQAIFNNLVALIWVRLGSFQSYVIDSKLVLGFVPRESRFATKPNPVSIFPNVSSLQHSFIDSKGHSGFVPREAYFAQLVLASFGRLGASSNLTLGPPRPIWLTLLKRRITTRNSISQR
jgi:hypothetical protein